MKIAIVEDSPVLRDMLVEVLETIDEVDIKVLADGEQTALQKMAEQPVDLAIIDLELKEGTGLGVIKNLRDAPEHYGKPKAVVFSNYAVSSMSRRCRALGVDRIYDKSFQLPELIDYIKSGLDSPKPLTNA